ncbi:MAG: hypothetical protein HY746_03370 [Elusimicrobia bacterium]|nr:hypothetical protein [Elusimicrobiota bacterium]
MKKSCNGFYVVVPKLKFRYETLHAIYSKDCIGTIETQLKKNNLKITDFFQNVKTKEITADIIKKFDPAFLSFFNINTPFNYRKALKIAETKSFECLP